MIQYNSYLKDIYKYIYNLLKIYIESSVWEDKEEGYMEFEMGERFLVIEKLDGKHQVKSTKTNEIGYVPSSKISILSSDLDPSQMFSRGRKNTTYQNLQMFQRKTDVKVFDKPLPVRPNVPNV